MMKGMSRILRMMQWRALNHSSVVDLWCTRHLTQHTHFDVTRVTKAHVNHLQAHWRILAVCHESRLDNCALQIWQCILGTKYVKARLNSCVRILDTGLLIPGNAAAFAAIWSKLRCTGELLAYVLIHILTNPAPLICQSTFPRRLSSWYWVHV